MNNLQVNDLVVAMRGMTPEQLIQIQEEARDQRMTFIERQQKKQERSIELINKTMQEFEKTTKKLDEKINETGKEVNGFVKTFMTNGDVKKSCEKYMHNLIYKVFEKNSLEDQLLHGYMTMKCKAHLVNTFPNVSSFNWLRVEDIDTILGITKSFLSPQNIHKLARKRVMDLHKEREKMEVKKIPLTYNKDKQFKLLEALLERVGYDVDLI